MVGQSSGSKDVRFIKANKELQYRVGTGKIDDETLIKAQDVLNKNTTDFYPVAKPDLEKLESALDEYNGDECDGGIKEKFTKPIMNLKANAGNFKYSIVSDLAGTVLTMLDNISSVDKKAVKIIKVLHQTILLAIYKEMKDGSEAAEKDLVTAFQEMCKSYRRERSS